MRLAPVLAGVVGVMLLAGAAAAATQAGPETPGLIGALAALLGCGDPFEAALLARDALDEAEFAAALEPWLEAGE
jgi:hypothetical protein